MSETGNSLGNGAKRRRPSVSEASPSALFATGSGDTPSRVFLSAEGGYEMNFRPSGCTDRVGQVQRLTPCPG